ncbi:MAG TPA: DUF4197 domain-containing protein [Flavobacteriales bacterium]|nr:DUF4197 domain-containing protein [Flavobacteriales bacterium]
MKTTILALTLISLLSCSTQEMQSVLDQIPSSSTGLSNEEVVSGLKEALRVGTERSVAKASVVDGFWNDPRIKIPFPAEAIKVKNTLTDLGIKKPVEDFERTLNKAAETAAKEAVPVFVEAITNMSIQDGFNLLKGGENAATDFLREKTSTALRAKFTPVVEQATTKVALTSYWTPLANAYNTASLLTGGTAVDPDLNAYVTTKAMDGLFLLLADEEKKIRQDPAARATALLQKVFSQQ